MTTIKVSINFSQTLIYKMSENILKNSKPITDTKYMLTLFHWISFWNFLPDMRHCAQTGRTTLYFFNISGDFSADNVQ